MNFVFWLLIVVAIVFLWFLLAFVFKPVGKFFIRLFTDAMLQMKPEDLDKEEN